MQWPVTLFVTLRVFAGVLGSSAAWAAWMVGMEDSLNHVNSLRWLPKARVVASTDRAIEAIRKNQPEIIFLDRDLVGPSFGEDVAKCLAAEKFGGQVVIHSANPFGAEIIFRVLSSASIRREVVPFTLLGITRALT